jgi:hypothetical protein
VKRPGMLDLPGGFKHDAWRALGALPAETARARFVDAVALCVLMGSARERRRLNGADGGFYADALARDDAPRFMRAVLAPEPGAPAREARAQAVPFAARGGSDGCSDADVASRAARRRGAAAGGAGRAVLRRGGGGGGRRRRVDRGGGAAVPGARR